MHDLFFIMGIGFDVEKAASSKSSRSTTISCEEGKLDGNIRHVREI